MTVVKPFLRYLLGHEVKGIRPGGTIIGKIVLGGNNECVEVTYSNERDNKLSGILILQSGIYFGIRLLSRQPGSQPQIENRTIDKLFSLMRV